MSYTFPVNIWHVYVINNSLEFIEELINKQFDDVLGFVPDTCWDKGWNTKNLKWTIEEIFDLDWNLKERPTDDEWLNSIYYWGIIIPMNKKRANMRKKVELKCLL